MDNLLQQLERLQNKLKDAESKKFRLEGQLESIKQEMKKLGYPTIAELKERKSTLSSDIIKKELVLQNEIDSFTKEFNHLLNEIGGF